MITWSADKVTAEVHHMKNQNYALKQYLEVKHDHHNLGHLLVTGLFRFCLINSEIEIKLYGTKLTMPAKFCRLACRSGNEGAKDATKRFGN